MSSGGLALAHGENWVRLQLAHVRVLMPALAEAAADLAEVLASGGVYHLRGVRGREVNLSAG